MGALTDKIDKQMLGMKSPYEEMKSKYANASRLDPKDNMQNLISGAAQAAGALMGIGVAQPGMGSLWPPTNVVTAPGCTRQELIARIYIQMLEQPGIMVLDPKERAVRAAREADGIIYAFSLPTEVK